MPIDFHDPGNAHTYAARHADPGWFTQVRDVLGGHEPGQVMDIGCGGGIYSRAWRQLGAESVTGLDFSQQMVNDAAATDDPAVTFVVASAYETGLAPESCDIVFSRAVVHHLDDHAAAFTEAFRILKKGGMLIVQDRTIEDVMQPASPQHIRAHFFSVFPRLLDQERARRPDTEDFRTTLRRIGFSSPSVQTFWETRRTYQSADELKQDLLARTGRSILHGLSDAELQVLTTTILESSSGQYPIDEQDRWTMWIAHKPSL